MLCPGHASLTPPEVKTERSGATEIARLGDDLVRVNQGGTMELGDHTSTDALAVLVMDGRKDDVTDEDLSLG
ncbi:MAG: hypothetical protein AUJ96_16390 [Armatimonadetes bacterium CG2_30_66_41]|nr:MAG: hypothetical protein AUJ96_16390 [Armatimonadetes bacterium CG2_30_66_41]PIU93101.1 MAG: hypothetical protein COS65_14455 [Armatimonadetes bacterium CG06_land_8_20_14_3_00_66_21]